MNIVQFSNFANEWPHQPQPHAKVRVICVKIGAYPRTLNCVLTRLSDPQRWQRLARSGEVCPTEDGRHTSERPVPSGSPVALLASLSYPGADGDGADEPELEQNNSKRRRTNGNTTLARTKRPVRRSEHGPSSFPLAVKHTSLHV